MMLWLTIPILLLLIAAMMLAIDASQLRKNKVIENRYNSILGQSGHEHSFTERLINLSSRYNLTNISFEFRKLLTQAGWNSRLGISIYIVLSRLMPIVTAVLVFIVMTHSGSDFARKIAASLFAFSLVFVGTNMTLRWFAARAVKLIKKELIPFIHILRMLFGAGLSLEHALMTLINESSDLFPQLSKHLAKVVQNVKSGQDQAESLLQMAKSLDIQEVTDTVAMLYQVSKYGGNIQTSLNQYVELMEDRQLSTMREHVTKLSAKMSIVMILFMFPALLIFIAGPGFLGLTAALGGMR